MLHKNLFWSYTTQQILEWERRKKKKAELLEEMLLTLKVLLKVPSMRWYHIKVLLFKNQNQKIIQKKLYLRKISIRFEMSEIRGTSKNTNIMKEEENVSFFC